MAAVTSCQYNVGSKPKPRVIADLRRLVGLFVIVCLNEVADRSAELAATGARVLRMEGRDRAKVAILLGNTVKVLSWGYQQATRRSWVGAWGAGPRILAAKWILWALVDDAGQTLTVAVTHMVPSVTRPAKGRIARLGRARRRAIYRRHVAAIVTWSKSVAGPIALHMDANAEPDFELLQPLIAAGFRPMTAPSHPSDDDDPRSIDGVWVRDCDPDEATALDGYSSDHKPVSATYTPQEAPVPNPKPGYPGANQDDAWFSGRYPGSTIRPNVGVLHTTETMGLPGYAGGASAPHYTAVPRFTAKRLDWFQHYKETESARALRNESGGVETNTLNALQLELVGTCDPRHRKTWVSGGKVYSAGRDYIYWPEAPEWALDELAAFLASANKRLNIMLIAPKFQAYPASYGANQRDGGSTNTVRFSFAGWRNFYGWCGHQHVPENTHGDPGNIDIATVLTKAKDLVNPQPKPTRVARLGKELEGKLAAVGAAIADAQATVEKYAKVPAERARVHQLVARIDEDLDAALADVAAASDDFDNIPTT